MAKTIVLTGGGTAGHITPNLALIPLLQARGWTVHYIGGRDGMERKLVEGLPGVAYYGVSCGKFRRYRDLKNLTDPFRVLKGVAEAAAVLRRVKPQVLFSKGGFVSVPVAWAARLSGVPMVLHESDLTPGLANRLALPMARRICTTFPETAKALGEKARHTGTPIRQALFAGDKGRGLALCGCSNDGMPTLLMMGGSQGASSINATLRAILPKLTRSMRVIHLCGQGNLAAELEGMAGYKQFEYVTDDLPDLLAASDLIVSRAGANSIYEFLALRRPMVLIPLPLSASRGDQIDNARSFAAQGFAHVLPQENMTENSLYDAILDAWANRDTMLRAMKTAEGGGDGTEAVLQEIEATAKK